METIEQVRSTEGQDTMTQHRLPLVVASGAAVLLALGACSTVETNTEPSEASPTASSQSVSPSASQQSPTQSTDSAKAGAWVSYAEYEQDPSKYAGSEVVLHFSAPWCPTCLATTVSLEETGVPGGLTVVKVDYDTSQHLKQEYGVTTQHTFVQIDEDGNEQTKFTGSITAEDIIANLV